MAKNVIRTHRAELQGLNAQSNASARQASGLSVAGTIISNLETVDLQKRSIANSEKWNNVNLAVDLVKTAYSIGSGIYDMIQSSDTATASDELSLEVEKGQQLVNKTIVTGESRFENTDSGELEFTFAPAVEEWYNSARESIENSNHMKSTKKSMLTSLELQYESLKTNAQTTAISQYYSNYNTAFTNNLEDCKTADIASYVAAGGNYETWNQTATITGLQTIRARTDWSDTEKAIQSYSYLNEIRKEGDTQIASNIAVTQGSQAAYEYVYGKTDESGTLSGGTKWTTAEKNSIYSAAKSAETSAKTAASEAATGYMNDALTTNSATAQQVYSSLEQEYANASPAIQQAAFNAAKAEQTTIVTTAVANQLASDKSEGIAAMYETYTDMKGGSWDGMFYNIGDVKEQALSDYQSAITSEQNRYDKSVKAIDDDNKEYYTQFETSQKTALALFDAGTISGSDYVKKVLGSYSTFIGQLKTGGEKDTSLWSEQATGAVSTALAQIVDNYIPTRLKDDFNSALDIVYTTLGLNLTDSKMTAETQQKKFEVNAAFAGKVADYIYSYRDDNETSLSADDFRSWVQSQAVSFALMVQDDGYSKLMTGEYGDETYMKNKVEDFKKAVELNYKYPSSSGTFVKIGTNVSTKEAEYTYANDEVKQTAEELQIIAMTEVSWMTGYDSSDMVVTWDKGTDGRPILSPLVTIMDGSGRTYRLKDGTIQISTNGGEFEETGIKLTYTVDEMQKQTAKSSTYTPAKEEEEFKAMPKETQQTVTTTDTWADNHSSPTTKDLYDYLSETGDIDAAADRLKTLGENGTITIPTPGLTTQEEVIDNIVNGIKQNRERSDTGTGTPSTVNNTEGGNSSKPRTRVNIITTSKTDDGKDYAGLLKTRKDVRF